MIQRPSSDLNHPWRISEVNVILNQIKDNVSAALFTSNSLTNFCLTFRNQSYWYLLVQNLRPIELRRDAGCVAQNAITRRMPLISRLRQFVSPQRIRDWVIAAEALWYDVWHDVRTRADPGEEELSITGDLSRGFWYRPVRPATGRALLDDLPIQSYSDYTFVDIGSGKGRMLLMAADYPFRRIEGIELRKDLHGAAIDNVRRYRNFKAKTARPPINCINDDATSYEFPSGNLVLYFFNPFNEEIMQRILDRLDASVLQNPRDVILIMLYPQFTASVEGMKTMRRLRESGHYRLYRSEIGMRP